MDLLYNLIRGCDSNPGAWMTLAGRKIQRFTSRKHVTRTFGMVRRRVGEVAEIGPESLRITAHGGEIEVVRLRPEGDRKLSAPEFVDATDLKVGTLLGC